VRHAATPRQTKELSKHRRLADLLDQASAAIESYLSLGEGPQDTIPLDMDSLNSAADYLTMSGLGPDAQQLRKFSRLFMESLTVITGINSHRNGVMSVQEFYRKAGFTDELSNCDTPEQREEELRIRWGLLRTTALDLQPLLRDLHSHLVRELSEGERDGQSATPGAAGGRQSGEGVPSSPAERISRSRRLWRWTCSTTAATYRMTIEAGASALLEKLSGR